MPDNTKSQSLSHIREITEMSMNHLVRQDPEIKGNVVIEAKKDGTFNISLHDGTQSEATVIELVDKETLLSMMEEQL